MRKVSIISQGIWLLLALGTVIQAEEAVDFDRTVAPLLASRCLDCHSGSEAKGGLDLRQEKTALKGGETGPAFVPGKLAESLLWQRIEQGEMPPKKPLTAEEKKIFQAWITSGASWGTSPIDPYQFSTSGRAGYDWWSLKPLVRPEPPPIKSDQAVSPIDAFVRQTLTAKNLSPAPAADRRTLLRRLAIDLTGLPPSPAELTAFVNDQAPDAYAKQVQRLLASPHYGERWARHWLDIAHFGESDGFEYDRIRPNAWRYRDWVITALNQDLPFDEFARLQIAGDVLLPNDPAATIATAFLVAGAYDSLVPAGDAMKQIMRQDELEDVVSLVSQSFLGLTVNCARCHDHKFDPIRQTDYYRLASALAGVRRGDRTLPPQNIPAELTQRKAELTQQIAAIEEPLKTKILAERAVAAQNGPARPVPFASWDFAENLEDSVGKMTGELHEGAKLENGTLVLESERAFAASSLLTKEIREKTLEAWVRLANLEQRGGAAIGVQTLDGNIFDAIVFGEQEPAHWMAGSNGFVRTKSFAGPAEVQAKDQFIHVAIVYAADGKITGYREGLPYGQPYQSEGIATFLPQKAQVIFGVRHFPAGAGKHLAGAIARANLYDRALSPSEVAASAGVPSTEIDEPELISHLEPAGRTRRQQLKTELINVGQQLTQYESTKAYTLTPAQPAEPTQLLVRGNPQQKGEVIAPAGLSALTSSGTDFGLGADAPEGARRKALAQWVASEKNPLFARTIVNRVWQYHFGRGLVETPNDLGYSGGLPSHPELLDWLASELIAQKWSLKELHRTIVLSQTYQQGSASHPAGLAVDADNRLLWRFSPKRLDAEVIRDAMLTITGQANLTVGGVSFQDFRPYLNKGAQFFEPQDFVGPDFHRRSIYRMWARGGKNPLLDTFDCPDPSTATPRRGSTTTPLQALSLLNNAFTLRMAEDFAKRVTAEVGDDPALQVSRAMELAYGRPPQETEQAASLVLVKQHGLAPLCRVLLNTNGFLYVH